MLLLVILTRAPQDKLALFSCHSNRAIIHGVSMGLQFLQTLSQLISSSQTPYQIAIFM